MWCWRTIEGEGGREEIVKRRDKVTGEEVLRRLNERRGRGGGRKIENKQHPEEEKDTARLEKVRK